MDGVPFGIRLRTKWEIFLWQIVDIFLNKIGMLYQQGSHKEDRRYSRTGFVGANNRCYGHTWFLHSLIPSLHGLFLDITVSHFVQATFTPKILYNRRCRYIYISPHFESGVITDWESSSPLARSIIFLKNISPFFYSWPSMGRWWSSELCFSIMFEAEREKNLKRAFFHLWGAV